MTLHLKVARWGSTASYSGMPFLLLRKTMLCAVVMVGIALMFPASAYANIGLPMIFVTYPMMLGALIPVILLEAGIFERGLHLGFRQAALRVGAANAASTILGFPLTWLLTVGIQMVTGGGGAHGISTWWGKVLAVTWQAPWLIPYEQEFYWMEPAAALVFLIPAFFASVFIEGHILKRLLKTEAQTAWQLTWKANRLSYLLLALIATIWLVYSVTTK